MANIGNLVAAGLSARNENTLALANLNFDFSLVKIDAPKEFLQLGKALSPWRRKNAEEGSTHRTARKLGALFEQVANPPEGLVAAYGRRASEISRAFGAREAGKQLGLFSDHAGVDATVLWAAAVSGKTAIAVALLACMLARIWDAPKATSIWVELVQKRKEQIQQICDGSELSHQALVAASRQDITRRDLAEWDASARAWLDIADRVKETEHGKMEAVLLKLSLPVDNSTDVFTSVIRVWKAAMIAMDNLCKGVPQRVYNGALLLAIISWHLYPDVDVFGGKAECVVQNDVLVSPAGRLTVGLEDADPDSAASVHWSLSLANLRFYGDPVLATSHVKDASRISFQELTLIYLGNLFAMWECGQFDPHFDQEKGAKFILALFKSIERIASDTTTSTPKRHAKLVYCYKNHWLSIFANAACKLLESNEKGHTAARKLVSLGTRQPRSLLTDRADCHFPCFGLLDARNWPRFALDGRSVHLLRELASRLKVKETNCRAIIHVGSPGSKDGDQFTTAFPLRGVTQDDEGFYEKHVRWIPESNGPSQKPSEGESPSSEIRTFSPDHIQKYGSTVRCARSPWDFQQNKAQLDTITEVNKLDRMLGDDVAGLYICPDDAGSRKRSNKKSAQQRTLRPMLALEDVVSLLEADLINVGLLILYMRYSGRPGPMKSAFFSGRSDESDESIGEDRVGPAYTVQYAIPGTAIGPTYIQYPIPGTVTSPTKDTPQTASQNLNERNECETIDNSDVDKIWQEIRHSVESEGYNFSSRIGNSTFEESMIALSITADIWSYLPNASISLNIIRHGLFAAPQLKYLSDRNRVLRTFGKWETLTEPDQRALVFSYIIMLETGDMKIPPDQLVHVFAISIRNTIYAAAALFTDPYTPLTWEEMRMIYRNVGRPGVSMMIPPGDPQLRKPNLESWRLINHDSLTADNQCDDTFCETSLHLSFTGYEQPFVPDERHGARDLEAYYLETVVTVFDGRERVGDIDVLRAFDATGARLDLVLDIVPPSSGCPHPLRPSQSPRWIVVASWEELLEMPRVKVCIVKAHGNALSRLATAVVCVQRGVKRCYVLPPNPCYSCAEGRIKNELNEDDLRQGTVALIC
ncbi:hypothetical protein GGR55DRAFT_642557 [Xylaria sp. FL0064]|nr:hypothetical protein GGR55DRAFT_642557 [Xylaria sp. FL0064]